MADNKIIAHIDTKIQIKKLPGSLLSSLSSYPIDDWFVSNLNS